MAGKEFVSPEHILSIVEGVMGHRVLLTFEAIIDKIDVKKLVYEIASEQV